jgi:hypothetical protein
VEKELKQYEELNGHGNPGAAPTTAINTNINNNNNTNESKSLGAKIQNINEKLDCLRTLCEPRENSFISYEFLKPPLQHLPATATTNNTELLELALQGFGRFKTSNTYPPLCNARVLDEATSNNNNNNNTNGLNGNCNGHHHTTNGGGSSVYESMSRRVSSGLVTNGGSGGSNSSNGLGNGNYPANLTVRLQIETVDYYGSKQREGGDPISALVTDPMSRQQLFRTPNDIVDCGNGLYHFKIVPNLIGKYRVDVSIFGRPINDMPVWLNIVENTDSVWTFGGAAASTFSPVNNTSSSASTTGITTSLSSSSLMRSFSLGANKGTGDRDFNMPISVRCVNKLIFILDSGNNRIKVLNQMGQFIAHMRHEGLAEASATAMAFKRCRPAEKGGNSGNNSSSNGNAFCLVTLNWRLKCMTTLSIGTLEDITTTKYIFFSFRVSENEILFSVKFFVLLCDMVFEIYENLKKIGQAQYCVV